MPLDPITSVAFTLHNRPGAHALLLGSGISSAAGIPNGWQVLVHLVRQVAVIHGQDPEDPIAWYRAQTGDEPTYSGTVGQLGVTAHERQALIRRLLYGGDSGQPPPPTPAHRAIAGLVAGGWIRVILTTNFDSLMESALTDAGVEPTVLATPEAVSGSVPLVHAGPIIVKLHGDYRDPRIKNTEAELDEYDEALNRLLDQVFDEYGLIVSGWSAEHDTALRKALERATSHRFTTFWVARGGEPRQAAAKLVRHRQAEVVPATDADDFFTRLLAACTSLREIDLAHPFSVSAEVATLKRELRGGGVPIVAHDTIRRELQRARDLTAGAPRDDHTQHSQLLRRVLAGLNMAVALVATLAYWGDETTDRWWTDDLARHLRRPAANGTVSLLDLPRVPSVVLLWAAGTAAVAANRDDLLAVLLALPEVPDPNTASPVSATLLACPQLLHSPDPVSDIYRVLRPTFVEHLALGLEEFVDSFERWQYLILVHSRAAVMPVSVDRDVPETHIRVEGFRPMEPVPHQWLVRQLQEKGAAHPLVRAGRQDEIDALIQEVHRVAKDLGERARNDDYGVIESRGVRMLPSGRHYGGYSIDDPDARFGITGD